MATYKNTTKQDIALIGIGVVKAGETIETDQVIENPNFKLVEVDKSKSKKEDGDGK